MRPAIGVIAGLTAVASYLAINYTGELLAGYSGGKACQPSCAGPDLADRLSCVGHRRFA